MSWQIACVEHIQYHMYINTIPMCAINKQKIFQMTARRIGDIFIKQIKGWYTWPAWEQRTGKKRVYVAHDWLFQCWMIYRTQEGHMICQLLNWFTFKTRLAIVRYSSHKIYHMIFWFHIQYEIFLLCPCFWPFHVRATVLLYTGSCVYHHGGIRLVWAHRRTLSEMHMS